METTNQADTTRAALEVAILHIEALNAEIEAARQAAEFYNERVPAIKPAPPSELAKLHAALNAAAAPPEAPEPQPEPTPEEAVLNAFSAAYRENYRKAYRAGCLDDNEKARPYVIAKIVLAITAANFQPHEPRDKKTARNLNNFV